MREELQINRAHWDEAAAIHMRGNVYGVESFKAGGCRLQRVECEEVGDVRGKTLLHLQCHFGLDALSWARRGAIVTGVDFSPTAIDAARAISAETGVRAEFICSSIDDLRTALPRKATFDAVFTSYGVLCWLPDLKPWAETIAHFLKAGGFFYIVEAHPTARIFPIDEDMPKAGSFRPYFNYFHDPAGMRWPGGADYADPSATNRFEQHEWRHSMADIVTALIDAGLIIEFLHEFPFCAWPVVAGCEVIERTDASKAYWGLPKSQPQLPLMFSLKASLSSPP